MLANSLRAQTRAILASSRVSSALRFTRPSPSSVCTRFSRLLTTSHVLREAGLARNAQRERDGEENAWEEAAPTERFSSLRPDGSSGPHSQPPRDEDATTTLFVGNLSSWASEQDLREIFSRFGDAEVRMKFKEDGQNWGYAHVEFTSVDTARQIMREHAKEALDFGGRMLRLDYSTSSKARQSYPQVDPATETPSPALFIGNIPFSADAEELQRVFSGMGEILAVRVVYDNEGVSKGFAHIDFANVEDAQRVVERQQEEPFQLQLRTLYVSYARRTLVGQDKTSNKKRNAPSETLWIGGLSSDVTEADLRSVIEPLGEIRDLRLTHANERRPGFAHLDFASVDVTQAIMEHHKESTLTLSNGKELLLDFAPGMMRKPEASNTLYVPSFEQNERLLRLCFGGHAAHIQSIRFVPLRSDESQVSAFIDFNDVSTATAAKAAVDNVEVQPGLRMKVLYSRKRSQSQSQSDAPRQNWGGRQGGGGGGRGPRKSSYGMRSE